MRVSDTERREVARRLREVPVRAVCDAIITLHCLIWPPNITYTGVNQLFARLADLIEPWHETTEDVSCDYGKFECKVCGCRVDDVTAVDNGGINFCPDCGREIGDD